MDTKDSTHNLSAMNRFIRYSVEHPWSIVSLFLVMSLAGAWSFIHLPFDAVPDITNNQVQINTTISGFIPEEIEKAITFPVERSMSGMEGVKDVRSSTRYGLSQVTVIFEDWVDRYLARQMVSERLQNIRSDLPEGAHSKLGPMSTGLGEIYHYTVDAREISNDPVLRFEQLQKAREIQDWVIRPRLLGTKGVAEVNSIGGYERQFVIEPNIQKMAMVQLHFDDLLRALDQANKNVGGGYVQETAESFLVQGVGRFKNLEDISHVTIKVLPNFKTLTIGDVAHVRQGKEVRLGAATMNGHETVLGTAMMLLGGNSRTVSKVVDAKMKEIAEVIPKEFQIQTVYNRSDLVDRTLKTVEHNLVLGAVLVIVILFLLLGNVRAAIITAITIPCSLLFALIWMKPLGISGNLMSLGALDFGVIVDGTVIVLEHCIRRLQEHRKRSGTILSREEIRELVIEATSDIRGAAGFGELIILCVFIPILFLTGIEGKMFIPMALTFMLAIVGAVLCSFSLAPALAGMCLSGKISEHEPWIVEKMQSLFTVCLRQLIRFRFFILGACACIGIAVIGFLGFCGTIFMPKLGEGSFAFHLIRPMNTHIDLSVDIQEKSERILKEFPEVSLTFSRLGTAEVASDPMGPNMSDTFIKLKDPKEWPVAQTGRKTHEQVMNAMVEKLGKILPLQSVLASQPIEMRFNELMEGTRSDLAIKVFGPSLDDNISVAKEIKEVLEKVQGAADVELDASEKLPILTITPKASEIKRYGAIMSEVLNVVEIGLGGKQVGDFYEGIRRYPIFTKLTASDRQDLSVIESLPVGLESQATVPLSKLANIAYTETFSVISREGSDRRTAVLVNIRNRDTQSFVEEAKRATKDSIQTKPDQLIEWGGNFKNLEAGKKRLSLVVPAAFLLILLMIFAALGSAKQTAVIIFTVPFSMVGGILTLYLQNLPLSMSAVVGFIAVAGISVLNGLVLINTFNKAQGEHLSTEELIRGTASRLRPIVMTSLVAILGFLPMMLSHAAGSEVQKPLATVVIGGLLSSSVLSLVVLPILMSLFLKATPNEPCAESTDVKTKLR